MTTTNEPDVRGMRGEQPVSDDVRKFYDEKEFIFAFDLDGRDHVVTIESVKPGELTGEGGRKSKKPIVTFVGAKKKWAVPKTCEKVIAAMYGHKAKDWAGKRITLYPTTTKFGPDTVECIRVRPTIPEAPKGAAK